jgi:hypothetical protein
MPVYDPSETLARSAPLAYASIREPSRLIMSRFILVPV